MLRILMISVFLFITAQSATADDEKGYIVCWHSYTTDQKNSKIYFVINSPQKVNISDIKKVEGGGTPGFADYSVFLIQKLGSPARYQYFKDKKAAKDFYDEKLKKAKERKERISRISRSLRGSMNLNGKIYKFR